MSGYQEIEKIGDWDWSGDGFATWPVEIAKIKDRWEVMWHDGEYQHGYDIAATRRFAELLLAACERIESQ